MVMEYNKKGRTSGSSPRDLQRRGSNHRDGSFDNELVLDLLDKVSTMNAEITELKLVGASTSPATTVFSDKVYSEQEFNEALTNALTKELANNTEVIKLNEELKSLKVVMGIREELIEMLKSQLVHDSNYLNTPVKVENRPSIEESVIDPTENKNIESHINIKEVKEEYNVIDKANKLKELLGG